MRDCTSWGDVASKALAAFPAQPGEVWGAILRAQLAGYTPTELTAFYYGPEPSPAFALVFGKWWRKPYTSVTAQAVRRHPREQPSCP